MRGELSLAWPKCYKKVARPGVYTSAGIGDGASLKLLQVWLVVELLRVPFGELFWIRWHPYYCCAHARACVRAWRGKCQGSNQMQEPTEGRVVGWIDVRQPTEGRAVGWIDVRQAIHDTW